MKFKPDTTIVIETNTGEVTTEGQQVKHGLVLHRTLNSSWGWKTLKKRSRPTAARPLLKSSRRPAACTNSALPPSTLLWKFCGPS